MFVGGEVGGGPAGIGDAAVGDPPDGQHVGVGVERGRDGAAAQFGNQRGGGGGAVVHGNIVIAGTLRTNCCEMVTH